MLAAAAVALFWLIVVFLAPAAMGLGDVRVLALSAGLLGWTSWTAVLYGQCLTFVLAAAIALGLGLFKPEQRAGGCRCRRAPRSSLPPSSRPGCEQRLPVWQYGQ